MSSELPPKLTPKVILEGTRLTHKTDIAFALNDYATGYDWIGGSRYDDFKVVRSRAFVIVKF